MFTFTLLVAAAKMSLLHLHDITRQLQWVGSLASVNSFKNTTLSLEKCHTSNLPKMSENPQAFTETMWV
jgi:hypothetical protein